MRRMGNTHFCFYCLSKCGFRLDDAGNATNTIDKDGYNGMEHHDPLTHAKGVIDGADKFDAAWDWMGAKIGSDFPLIVCIT